MKMFKRIFRRRLLVLPLVLVVGFVLTNCSQEASKTPFAQKLADDSADFSNTYDKLVLGCGQDAVDQLIEGVGWDTLDRLSYGVGVSNVIDLINLLVAGDMPRLIEMIVGLGPTRTTNMLHTIDAMMEVNKWTGAPPVDDDTITILATFISQLNIADPTAITAKIVPLVDAMPISYHFNAGGTTDQDNMDKLSRLIAHVEDTTGKLVDFMSRMTAARFSDALPQLMAGLTFLKVETMVEILDWINGDTAKIVQLLEDIWAYPVTGGVAGINNMIAVINSLDSGVPFYGGQKIAYIVGANGVTNLATLVTVVCDVAIPSNLGALINEAEETGDGGWGGPFDHEWDFANALPDNEAAPYSTIKRLVFLMDGLAGGINPDKLVAVMDQVTIDPDGVGGPYTPMTKMMRLITDIMQCHDTGSAEDNDLVTVISSLSTALQAEKLGLVVNNIANDATLSHMPLMVRLVDGKRICAVVGGQPAYLASLVIVVENLSTVDQGPLKIAQMLVEFVIAEACNLVNLVYDVGQILPVGKEPTLAQIINALDPADDVDPNKRNAVHTMALVVKAAAGTALVDLIDCITAPLNVADLVNGVAERHVIADPLLPDLAGQKLSPIINLVTDTGPPCDDHDLAFLINRVSSVEPKMCDLFFQLTQATCNVMAVQLINNIEAGNFLPAVPVGCEDTAVGMGKMVNMVDEITNLSDVAVLMNGVTDLTKMASLINDVAGTHHSCNLVSLLNEIIALAAVPGEVNPPPTTALMAALLNDPLMTAAEMPKLSQLISDLDGAEDTLLANLTGPSTGDPATDGIGNTDMALLISQLDCSGTPPPACTDVTNLQALLTGLNANLCYREGADCGCAVPNVTKREGMVRMVNGGLDYDCPGITAFPGLGPWHIAGMMDSVTTVSMLVTLMNAVDLDCAVTTVGCGDCVGGCPPHAPYPNFRTPCCACNFSWTYDVLPGPPDGTPDCPCP